MSRNEDRPLRYPAADLEASLKRALSGGAYIHMDGHSMRNDFLSAGWNYAIDMGWLRVVHVDLEQETYMKGYLTEKGRVGLGL